MVRPMSIERFRALFSGDEEFALIDPRSAGEFATGHILAASNLPLARIEAEVAHVIPLVDTLCVLCDATGGEAEQAAGLLTSMGYSSIEILDGGIDAWRATGGEVFTGVSVPGKAFGEFVEREFQTPAITAEEFQRRRENGDSFLLIDSRSSEEHGSYCIPGAVLCPGGELLYRVLPVLDEDIEIVVHCGGRTRSIIGAQTLIDAGCQRVHALENGTMAWQFAGYDLEHGSEATLPLPDPASLEPVRELAGRLAAEGYIDRMRSIPLQATRTRYLIDVRSREEYEGGHIPGSRHVPGGHLLQNLDRFLVVRNSTVVLIDSDRVRATTVALWLRRMQWRRVFVFSLDDDKQDLEFGPGGIPSPDEDRDLDPRDYAEMEKLLQENRAYLDWELGLIEQIPGDPAAPYCKDS